MPETGHRLPLSETELEPVVARLALLRGSEEGDTSADRVAKDGVHPAAWCIGETLAACGGYDLMWLVYRMFEDRHGLAGGRWLDSSWDGIQIEPVVRWEAGDGLLPGE